jgi:Alpha/beta hydrolase family
MCVVTVAVRVLLAIACIAVTAWVAATRWETLLAGHPAYPVLLAAVALVGIVIGLRARRPRRGGAIRVAGRAVGAVVLVGLLVAIVWLRPYAATVVEPSSAVVEVVHTTSTWELRPIGAPRGVGVVFYPGALVDPRAYLPLLRPLAEDGHLVVVVSAPLDVALLAPSAVTTAIDTHPAVGTWAVGGHSLGGVAASTVAAAGDPRVRGLFLWASYPAQDISGARVTAASISGDRDGLSKPAEIEASRADLPPGTTFTVVAGGVHAYFGDYGPQAGDGRPGITRADAQQQIVAATRSFVAAVAR